MPLYRCKRRIKGVQCDARNAKRKPLEQYVYDQKCWKCGQVLSYRDKNQEQRNKDTACHCDGISVHHRKGQRGYIRGLLMVCNDRELTEEDQQELYNQRG